MPTYSYACTECGHRFDTVQAFTDASLTECPQCAGRLRKLFSSVGIVFKGSGFYRTDSRAGANGGESKESADASAGAKESGAKESGAKESGATGSGSKDTGGTGAKESAPSGGGGASTPSSGSPSSSSSSSSASAGSAAAGS